MIAVPYLKVFFKITCIVRLKIFLYLAFLKVRTPLPLQSKLRLNYWYSLNNYPDFESKILMARNLQLTFSQVKYWFSNERKKRLKLLNRTNLQNS